MSPLKDAIKKGLYRTGYYELLGRLKAPPEKRLLVIMYHDLSNQQQPGFRIRYSSELTWDRFRKHVEIIRKLFRIATVEDCLKEINEKGQLESDTVALTFDDGYVSNYEIAFPILKSYNVSATIYLLTDWINETFSPWWFMLRRLIWGCDLAFLGQKRLGALLQIEMPDSLFSERGENELRRRVVAFVESYLRNGPSGVTDDLLHRLGVEFGSLNQTAYSQPKPLSWDQIREMSQYGIRFGAHTRTHPNLKFVSPEIAEREFAESKGEIENRIDAKVSGLAYPFGMDSQTYSHLATILARSGFAYGCTAIHGFNNHNTNPLLLHRISLPSTESEAILGRDLRLSFLGR